MGDDTERERFLTQVRKACVIGKKLRELGARRYGVIRIDSATSPADWAGDPDGNTKRIADTFRRACDIAAAACVTRVRKCTRCGWRGFGTPPIRSGLDLIDPFVRLHWSMCTVRADERAGEQYEICGEEGRPWVGSRSSSRSWSR